MKVKVVYPVMDKVNVLFLRLRRIARWLFLIAGGMTIAYMTKLFVVLFVDKPTGDVHHGAKNYANPLSRMAITVSALILPVLGLLFRTGTVLSTRSICGMGGLRAYDNFNGFEFLRQ